VVKLKFDFLFSFFIVFSLIEMKMCNIDIIINVDRIIQFMGDVCGINPCFLAC